MNVNQNSLQLYRSWLIAIIFLLGIISESTAQTYIIKGQVNDKDAEEGLPFVNIYMVSSVEDADFPIGTTTDINGFFELETDKLGDTLIVSAIGYRTVKKLIQVISLQEINFSLETTTTNLNEIVVYAGENPANNIVRDIINNKNNHNLEKKQTYYCERYSKIELDLHNYKDDMFERRALKSFDFILDNVDSTSDEKTFLPAYINENIDDLYYVKRRPLREVPRATRVSGIDGSTIVSQVKRITERFNVYDNFIPILEKNFVSPFSNLGLLYYEYYIMDSTTIENQLTYNLKFKPRRKQENTFYGDFWVADSTFAIVRLNMNKSEDVNINLVDRVTIFEEYTYRDSIWLPYKQKMLVDFQPTGKLPGIISRKTSLFKGFIINEDSLRAVYEKEDPEDYTIEGLEKPDEYWNDTRHEKLSGNEEVIYQMIDSIKSTPIYQKYNDIVYALTSGWVKVGKLEVGPYFNTIGGNMVEGNRFQLGLGTNLEFSTKYRGEVWAAYGTRDEKWKYGGKFQYNFKKQPRREFVGGQFFNDVIFSNQSTEDLMGSSSIANSLRRDMPQRLLHSQEAKLFYLKEWKRGWSGRATILNREIDPYGGIYADGSGFNFQYIVPETNEIDTVVTTTEFIFKFRHAYKEQYWAGHFDKISYGSRYPIYSFQYIAGVKNILGSNYNYHKIAFDLNHWFPLSPFGWTRYYVKAGKVFGTLPMLLLEVHPGNETYFYASDGFNVMNNYEFVSDTYVSWVFAHHFEGFFLNKIPLLKKLDWRSLVHFRGVWGTLSAANQAANSLNSSDVGGVMEFRSPYPLPYMEAGVGIENIFKVFHIEASWRLSYMDNPEAYNFMLQGGVYFYF